MHIDGDPEPRGDLFIVRQESQCGDGVDQDGAQASVEGAVHVAVLGLDLQTHHHTAGSPANKLALKYIETN
jgi:hypothetical protein